MVQGAWAGAHWGEGAGCQGRDGAPACQSCPLGAPLRAGLAQAHPWLTLGAGVLALLRVGPGRPCGCSEVCPS